MTYFRLTRVENNGPFGQATSDKVVVSAPEVLQANTQQAGKAVAEVRAVPCC